MTRTESLSRLRPIQKVKPGWWLLGEFIRNADGSHFEAWWQANTILELESPVHGPLVRIYGVDTTGESVEFDQRRGYSVETVTEREGARCGLVVPKPEAAQS